MTRALVFHADPRRPWLAARSVRNLKAAGIDEISIGEVVEGNGPTVSERACWGTLRSRAASMFCMST